MTENIALICSSYHDCTQNKNCTLDNTPPDFKNKPACFCSRHKKVLVESADWREMGGHSLEEFAKELTRLIDKYKKQDHHIVVEGSCIEIYCYENEM